MFRYSDFARWRYRIHVHATPKLFQSTEYYMSRRLRRTKIVTTLGPATDRDNNLEKVIAAGANVVRMNFSHGTAEDHQLRADKVREIAAKLGRQLLSLAIYRGRKFASLPSKKAKFSSISVINSCSTRTWVKAKAIKKKSASIIKACRLTWFLAISCCWTTGACS